MTMFQPIGAASVKAMDRAVATLVAGLEIEFGQGAGAALAQRFLEAEECDFLWNARLSERWLGAYQAQDEEDFELDRVAIIGRLDGRWFVAVIIVDGDGNAHGLMARRSFGREHQASVAFANLH